MPLALRVGLGASFGGRGTTSAPPQPKSAGRCWEGRSLSVRLAVLQCKRLWKAWKVGITDGRGRARGDAANSGATIGRTSISRSDERTLAPSQHSIPVAPLTASGFNHHDRPSERVMIEGEAGAEPEVVFYRQTGGVWLVWVFVLFFVGGAIGCAIGTARATGIGTKMVLAFLSVFCLAFAWPLFQGARNLRRRDPPPLSFDREGFWITLGKARYRIPWSEIASYRVKPHPADYHLPIEKRARYLEIKLCSPRRMFRVPPSERLRWFSGRTADRPGAYKVELVPLHFGASPDRFAELLQTYAGLEALPASTERDER